MEFDVTASIETDGGLRFEKETVLLSPSPGIKLVSLAGNGEVSCSLKVLAASEREATDTAYSFVSFLAELLTYLYSARTKAVVIRGCSCKSESGVHLTATLSFSADALLVRLVTPDASEALLRLVRRALPERARDLLGMFRQARNEQSVGARYLLMYRLLEYYNGGWSAADSWIKRKRPHVEEVDVRNGKRVTIYTDLRNRIHARNTETLYPYPEITKRIGELEELAKLALDEACELP